MANVIVKGKFLGCSSPKKQIFDGKEKTSFKVDIYQPESDDNNKNVSVKVEDLSTFETFANDFGMGDDVSVLCSVNAYQNMAYYKFVSLIAG